MSDFDREAEREKLREKYERDKQKREAAEDMSELLLQGATMTNRHCPECHSPVFRYEGREFCPTCKRAVTEDGEFPDESSQGTDVEADAATNGDAATPTEEAEADPESESKAESEGEPGSASDPESIREDVAPEPSSADSTPGESDAETQTETESDPDDSREYEESTEPAAPETRPAPTGEHRPARIDPPARREAPTATTEGDDLREAEAALRREIASLARQAEETRDVGRKRDLFSAAREAAETLQTVRRL